MRPRLCPYILMFALVCLPGIANAQGSIQAARNLALAREGVTKLETALRAIAPSGSSSSASIIKALQDKKVFDNDPEIGALIALYQTGFVPEDVMAAVQGNQVMRNVVSALVRNPRPIAESGAFGRMVGKGAEGNGLYGSECDIVIGHTSLLQLQSDLGRVGWLLPKTVPVPTTPGFNAWPRSIREELAEGKSMSAAVGKSGFKEAGTVSSGALGRKYTRWEQGAGYVVYTQDGLKDFAFPVVRRGTYTTVNRWQYSYNWDEFAVQDGSAMVLQVRDVKIVDGEPQLEVDFVSEWPDRTVPAGIKETATLTQHSGSWVGSTDQGTRVVLRLDYDSGHPIDLSFERNPAKEATFARVGDKGLECKTCGSVTTAEEDQAIRYCPTCQKFHPATNSHGRFASQQFHWLMGNDADARRVYVELRGRVEAATELAFKNGENTTPLTHSPEAVEALTQAEKTAPARNTGTPTLDSLGRDLTHEAELEELDPVIGRDGEVDRAIQILSRRRKNNPILIGKPGVGKTAIAEGIAQRIVSGDVPESLEGKRLVLLDMTDLVAGTKWRGDLEERVKRLKQELRDHPEVILFVDEVHTLAEAGGDTVGAFGVSEMIKGALARGEMQVLGATTWDDFRTMEENSALARRFEKVVVDPPSRDEAVEILMGVKHLYEDHHGVQITRPAVEAAVDLSMRYLPTQQLPDKALDLLDDAAASGTHKRIGPDQVRAEIEKRTGIPVRTSAEEARYALGMEDFLNEFVLGQPDGAYAISNAVIRNRAGLSDPDRPTGSFLLVGPTGNGKTLTARGTARFLFDDEQALVRLDMSEYGAPFSSSRLIGDARNPGTLTEPVRQRPYQVILLDELDRAEAGAFDVLMPILDNGRTLDGSQREADFRNTIMMATTNRAAQLVEQGASQEEILAELEKYFPREFLQRFDAIIPMRPLTPEVVRGIVDQFVTKTTEKVATRGITLTVTDKARNQLATEGYDRLRGARPMRRAIQDLVETTLARQILEGTFVRGDHVRVDYGTKGFTTKKVNSGQ